MEKGRVCVTGGTGFVASWLIKRLLEDGYSVHATTRDPGKNDMSYLTNLPRAKEKLKLFAADLSEPDSFNEAIDGCIGVFHVAHPLDFENREPEEVVIQRAIRGTLGILRACLDSKSVKRVVYTSSVAAVQFSNDKEREMVDESVWSDVDYARKVKYLGNSYVVSKTLTEKAALDFAQQNGLDLVTVLPSMITGPFINPQIPGSVSAALSMILGIKEMYHFLYKVSMVHTEDVARAHIFLLEYSDAKGRYICSSDDTSILELAEFLSTKYPEYQIPSAGELKDVKGYGYEQKPNVSKKLLETGFKYKYGIPEMFEGAIECCKEKGLL
ncbi:NAD-dependent epimerase/dehydratase [Dillenia turbinata]|uniref:NAD-dependent epimerase/dehydratase n=1 Tax=Dillenia turbinata TaxID=194707 RepID=A0AAN8UZB7_9MAGN